jgi:hypothetical protein
MKWVPLGLVSISLALGFGSQALRAQESKFILRYKLSAGQLLRSEVTHLAKTDTKIEKTQQSSQSRTISQKVWEVKSVDPTGNMTFVYRIDAVDLSQQIGSEPEIRYDSTSKMEPPAMYKKISEAIGKPISTVTINPRGEVVQRDENTGTPNLGMGDITLVMPAEAVAVGHQWSVPREVRVRGDEGGQQAIKIQEQYTLEKVSAGVATITVKSIPLTPLSSAAIESQVMQQMSNGTIKFDMDAGCLISKQLLWDETVVGFSGPGSILEYSARFDEEMKAVSAAARSARGPATSPKK